MSRSYTVFTEIVGKFDPATIFRATADLVIVVPVRGHHNPIDAVRLCMWRSSYSWRYASLAEREDGLCRHSHFHDHVDAHSVPFGAGRNGAQISKRLRLLKIPLLIKA